MITVRAITNNFRDSFDWDENDTVRNFLEENEIDYSVGVTSIDGSPLKVGDMDKTFAQLGIESTCYLSVVVKADNAAKMTIVGGAVVVTSDADLETLKTIKKFRPNLLNLYEGEGDAKRRVFRIDLTDETGGDLNAQKAVFSTITNADNHPTITMCWDTNEAKDDGFSIAEAAYEMFGPALLKLNKTEAQFAAALDEIAAEKAAVAASIEIL